MVVLTLACAGFWLLSMAGVVAGTNERTTGAGIGCCVLGGTGVAGTVWVIGMLPLSLLYLVFRKPEPPASSSAPPTEPPAETEIYRPAPGEDQPESLGWILAILALVAIAALLWQKLG